ncbi:MAG TPA: type VI secretion system baseplate subunit TssG [Bryobacteraceae bacterium]|nr:type VI secretion system baseplate subunit TssG [Bryobacteraceae bacterium]
MESESRSAVADVGLPEFVPELQHRPGSFDFFQAVRLLKLVLPQRDGVRFHANPKLEFPPAQIERLQISEGLAHLAENFFGLVGPLGVLPYFYSEIVSDRTRAKDTALGAFLDIFHQRLLTLLCQAWQSQRFWATWEQGEHDGVTSALLALLGLRTDGLANRQKISDQALLFYTGLLAMQTRPARSLEQILADYFQVPAEVQQFAGAWYLLPEAQQCRLGNESRFEELGMGAIVGDAIWNQQSRVRIVLGPMPLNRFREFLPDGPAYGETEALIEFFANRQLDFELQLLLDRTEVPVFQLGEELPLGWCLWLKTEEFATNPGDAVLPLGQQLCM